MLVMNILIARTQPLGLECFPQTSDKGAALVVAKVKAYES